MTAPAADRLAALTGDPWMLTADALAGGQQTLAGHLRAHGSLPYDVAGLVQLTADAALTGRGGAGFPTARKLAAVAAGSRPVVVANGAEGEPASHKDATLLQLVPHLVLDGLVLAARTVRSREAYVYVPDGPLVGHLRRALAERADRLRVTVVAAPDRFLSGEESAVVQAIARRAAIPRSTPPRVFEKGLRGRPTLVQNVETLAQLALLARHRPDRLRAGGPADAPGTRLFSVGGAVRTPGVVEAPAASTARDLLQRAGGARDPLQAVLVGGYHGGWLPYAPFADLPLTDATLRPAGALVGAGVLIALPAASCGLAETARVLHYLAEESAGQCGPCLSGLPALASAMDTLARRAGTPTLLNRIEQLAGLVDGRGACHHPDGSVRFARSALRTFADEVDRHLAGSCTGTAQPVLPIPRTNRW